MEKNYPWFRLSPSFISSISALCMLLFLVSFEAKAQDYTTTGNSSNWFDAAAWNCSGGPCNANPYPNNVVKNTTITINHSIDYQDNSPIKLRNNGDLIIANNATLNISSNLNIEGGGMLDVNNGQIDIGPSVLNNDGVINLTNALLTKNGNIVNGGEINLNSSCIHVLSGNFNNSDEVNGTGGVKVLSGNINNNQTWSSNVVYYLSGNSSGLPGSSSTEEEVDAFCECIVLNCDILPGYNGDPKVDDIIGNALISLFNNFDNYDPNFGTNQFIYQTRPELNPSEVLIEIVLFDNNYNAVLGYLGGLGIGMGDLISDVYHPADDQRVITLFFPIESLNDLNQQSQIIRQVFAVSAAIPNTGLIPSQGDAAQNSNIARLGWNLSGAGIKIGVISDSFDTRFGAGTDITNGDLPGGTDAVTVVQDYPYGQASDEGRAMLQIIHDVAPDAELFFRTGFVSEGNMAAGIEELVALGCDVIVDDLTYMKGPYFQDGVIADAVEAATAAGVSYFSSAGNFGTRSFEGTFTPLGSNPLRHDFGGGTDLQQLTLGTGQYIIALQWDNDWSSLGSLTGAMQDLDIYLANDDGSVLYGFNRDNAGNDPVEIMPFVVVNPTTTNIVIENLTGGSVDFKYVVFRAGDDGNFDAVPALNESTVVGHANAVNSISVGAVRYDNTPNYGGVFTAQQSSSRGGTTTNSQIRQQPLIMSPTGVNTSVDLGAPNFEGPSDPYPNFFGTSASAPHAAGIAALVLEAKQTYGVDPSNTDPNFSIRNLMINNATDMGAPGYDINNGYGFVEANNVVGSFSNPSPNLIQFNLDNLDPLLEPGDEEFVVIIEGEFFTEESVVIFRGDELETTFIDENTLEATIPEFIGNPPIYVFTPPNALTNGSDGGDSDPLTFDDIVILDVVVKADDVSRRYGEANPGSFTFTTDVDGTGVPLTQEELDLLLLPTPSVSLSTAADATSTVGIYAIDVELTNINVGLLELYNFIAEPGALVIDPMPVTIQPSPIDPIVYGDPIPDITFDYTFGEPGGTPATVDAAVANSFATNHTNILSLANGFGLVNAGNLVNILSIVNDEPTLNLLSLVNMNIYASDSSLDQANTVTQNLLSLVNGTGDEKVVEIGADLFDPANTVDGETSSITNLVSLVNILSLANGTSIVNGISIANGVSLTNILSLANGVPIANIVSLVNGGMNLVNGVPITNSAAVASVYDALANSYSIVNTSDIPSDPNAPPIPLKPINVFTGLDAGTQYVIPGGILDNNFEVYFQPRGFEILPADLIITTEDVSTVYGDDLPEFTASIPPADLKLGDTEADVFPEGLAFSVPCTECGVGSHMISAAAVNDNVSGNYNVTFDNSGLLTVNQFDLTVTVDDATINYGDLGPFAFTTSSDPVALPYGELLNDVLGTLSFTPNDGCTSDSTISVDPQVQPDNYNVTYLDGTLTINNATLTIEVLPAFIAEGDPIPSFDVQISGLVCNDSEPVITSFTFQDQNGNPVSPPLDAGEYSVIADVSGLSGYDNYDISAVAGSLFVNPSVGCNERIKATDLCQEPASLAGEPSINTLLRFTYENRLDIPIYVPLGPNNKLKGNAYTVGSPPELFLPGTHTFEIYTNGGRLQWEIRTPGCGSVFKSPNGSNANLCSASAKVDVTDFDESIVMDEGISGIYPNPVESSIVFPMHGQHTSFSIKVFNEVGMLVKQKDYPVNTYYDVTMDISMLKSGMLYFMIEKNGKREMHTILKR